LRFMSEFPAFSGFSFLTPFDHIDIFLISGQRPELSYSL
jgi:hypothetical protein